MQVFHHVASLREALAKARADGKTVGFVPTMGNLHDAHIELVKLAQQHCDLVVVSIFVNRLQFGLNEDWDKYPRTMERDMARLREAECDFLFHPDENEIYPNGMDQQTRVVCPAMTDVLCGASRPGHFEGLQRWYPSCSILCSLIRPSSVSRISSSWQLSAVWWRTCACRWRSWPRRYIAKTMAWR